MEKSQTELDPWSLYLGAMNAPITREKYTGKFAKFLDFIGLEGGSLEERVRTFAKRSKTDFNWAFASLLKFIQFQKERVERKEITGATVRNTRPSGSNIAGPISATSASGHAWGRVDGVALSIIH